MKRNLVLLIFTLVFAACSFQEAAAGEKKFLVIAIDGMDYTVLREMIERGEMPNFDHLRKTGDFRPLATSIPPQSPVAWSNFITGMDPGGHGIFDFIHRTPGDFSPYLSTSRTEPASKVLSIGKYRIPLKSEEIKLLRKGKAFWEILEEHGVPSTIISIPSNFPPIENAGRSLSGMGTPDLLGSYGTFTYMTSDRTEKDREVTGGVIQYAEIHDNTVESRIPGPRNTLVEDSPATQADLKVYIDPEHDVVKIVVQDNEIILSQGEWSGFVPLEFEMIPWTVHVSGIVRFYLKEVRPHFKLYVSPVNIDPSDPAMPITSPEDYAEELYKNIGYFYTQGMAEDTKALDNGILSEADFLAQGRIILDERMKILDYELKKFRKGFLFFYISTIDLSSHMYWRFISKDHPDYHSEEFRKYRGIIYDLYKKMDDILSFVNQRIDSDTVLMVMSDHGFRDFRRQVNVNTWLAEEGYLELSSGWTPEDEFFSSVNWSNTRAYALGINGVYINQRGREVNGTVEPGQEYAELVDEIVKKLEAMTDPLTGKKVVRKAYRKRDAYHGPYVDDAPDIVVGFYSGYRSSDESALGQFSGEVISNNTRKWSGDHCMDYREVPGIILMNRKIKREEPALYDVAPTILKEFGIEPPKEMTGQSIY